MYSLRFVGPQSPTTRTQSYRFGPYEADVRRCELRKYGIRIRLERKPWQVLLLLLEHPGELVTRKHLQRQLWGENVFVDFENGLTVAIKKLRAALNDSAEAPVYVETIAGEGYRFVGIVETAMPDALETPAPAKTLPESAEEPISPSQPPPRTVSTRANRWLTFAVAMLAAAAGMSAWLVKSPLPPSNATVLIWAFENTTGEPVLDGTLRFALERELSNSGHVRVVSPERVQDILKLMRRPPGSNLDRELALEMCRRTPGIRALITGRAQKIGSRYLLTAEVIDPADGAMLRAGEAQASNQEEVLAAIHSLSAQLRSEVLDSVSGSPISAPSLEVVTTKSLHALQLYSQASNLMIDGSDVAGVIHLLEQALAEDPDFPSAHIMLAWQLFNSGLPSTEHFERALALSDTASERERLFIQGSYYEVKVVNPGDPAALRAMAAYQELLRLFPDDFWATNNLAGLYRGAGRTREALLLQVRKAELRPESGDQDIPGLWTSLMSIGESGGADRLTTLCSSRLDVPQCPEVILTRDTLPLWRAIREGHPDEALGIAQRVNRQYWQSPVMLQALQSTLSQAYLDMGMFRAELELSEGSQITEERFTGPALVAYYRGDKIAESAAWMEVAKHPDLIGPSTVMRLAALGQFQEAESALANLKRMQPIQFAHLARGYLELERGQIAESIRDLRLGNSYYQEQHFSALSKASDHLATALERAGDAHQALQVLMDTETQLASQSDRDFVDHWNLVTRQHLARLYRQAGYTAEADAIESALRAQLGLSDSGHIVLQALKQQSPSYQAALH